MAGEYSGVSYPPFYLYGLFFTLVSSFHPNLSASLITTVALCPVLTLSPLHFSFTCCCAFSNTYYILHLKGSIVPLLSIEISASVDMIHWKKLEFRYYHKPSWFAPHQPRLDHLMFYESCKFRFSHSSVNGINDAWPSKGPDCYFSRFLKKFCEGEPSVCGLLQKDPFASGDNGVDDESSRESVARREDIVCVRVNHYLNSKFSRWKTLRRQMQEDAAEGLPEEERTKFDYWHDEGLVLREIYEWDRGSRTLQKTTWGDMRYYFLPLFLLLWSFFLFKTSTNHLG